MNTIRKNKVLPILLGALFVASVTIFPSCGGPKKAKRSKCVSKAKYNKTKSTTKFMMN